MNILAPSMLSANFLHLQDDFDAIKKGGAKYLHVDVMDGMFVPSMSFAMPVIKSIRKGCDLFFDVHLMIQDPERYIDDFAKSGADMITIHAEACTHLDRTLQAIHDAGCKAGLALCPATPLSVLDYLWNKVDMILLMTVNPGFGGQAYIPEMTDKIRELRTLITKKNLLIDIEVDGGIKASNVNVVLEAGANVIVAGSAVFGEGDVEGRTAEFMKILESYEK